MALSDRTMALQSLARFIGIVAPTLYCGITCQYSLTFVQPIVEHAPNQKVMAKQWLRGYQYGPLWVPPLVLSGTAANAFLAYLASSGSDAAQRNVYVAAALGVFSIAPITFLYMEPGINGAAKWKAQMLLKDEGLNMAHTKVFMPSAHKHGASESSKRWAERADMKELILFWRKVNNWRWVIGGVAAGLSGYATFAWL